MPSSQIQTNIIMNGQSGTIINKAPPPNKLPPPPPPPPQPPPPLPRPKTTRLPPPPPPPRNSSQLLNQTNIPLNPLCASNNLNISTSSANNILNNGSSINSLNSAGRCSYTQSLGGGMPNSTNHNQRSFMSKHGDTCSSRSSVSSHSSSLQHHHHSNNLNNNNNNNSTVGSFNNTFNHQSNLGCSCSSSNTPHNHVNSSSLSDCGSCNYSQENRNFPQGGCCAPSNNNSHHMHNITMSKCQVPNINSNSSGVRIYNNGSSTTTTISRNALLYNPESIESDATSNGCNSEQNRGHRQSVHPHPHHHHHHHHNMHNVPMSSSSSLSSLQPVDPNISSSPFYRCNMPQSNVAATTSGVVSDQIERPSVINHCNHLHRTNACGHHHPLNFCEHHIPTATTAVQQQVSNNCINCLHAHNAPTHQECNSSSLIGKNCSISNQQHRCPSELLPINQSSDASQNDSLVSTAHTHNLSNSSTTTHTSNVAVKHQPQFHRPVLSRGGRSNSSQQYEYGPSSAASTSSATASLSSYQTPSGYDDRIPLYPSSKIHQPLPPPPPPTSSRSRPHTPQMLISSSGDVHDSSNLQILTNNLAPPSSQFLQQQQQPNINQTIPTLPPKPTSPNPSSHSTQITTLRTSPSFQNQPITRVTSQAGVQDPLPNSDIPPPLPPLYPGSRTQPIVNTLMNRMPNISDIPLNPIPSFVNLNLNRTNSTVTSAERKTEALTRQIEFELEQQQKSGEPYGICPKCGDKVMPAQDACKAMDQIYHAACFVCCECNRTLRGKTFYPVGDKVYCEEDFNYTGHMQSLEKCAACAQPIFDMVSYISFGKSI